MNETKAPVEAPQGTDASKKKLISGLIIAFVYLLGSAVLIGVGGLVAMAGGMAAGSNAGGPDADFDNMMALAPCVIVPILMILGIVAAVWIYKRVNK